jgi:hypothetical protein
MILKRYLRHVLLKYINSLQRLTNLATLVNNPGQSGSGSIPAIAGERGLLKGMLNSRSTVQNRV